ncbi:MAG: outer membrane protein assembly factor BamE [Rubrivivax sp.]|nr:outer membrane protein assembly factor BamE [Rubrivivax sp.]
MFRALLSACALLALGGCASQLKTSESLFGLVTPYRMEIVQGNVITKEQMDRVKVGMSRRQVRDALGSPLVTDIFHADRWDYLFVIRRQGAEPQRRAITLVFAGDALKTIAAPELPTEREFVSSITRQREFTARKLELTAEERAALPKPPPRADPAAEPVGPVRPYPPLEDS